MDGCHAPTRRATGGLLHIMWLTDIQKFGAGLIAAGVFCLTLGVITLFDARLLSFGNILFIVGIIFIIGAPRTIAFFTRRRKIKGSVLFALGAILILYRRSFIGFGIEMFGILNLFGDFLGVVVSFLRQLPFIGPLLTNPNVAPTIDRLADVHILPV